MYYKVCVVDDEPVARYHICALIEKRCSDFQIIMTAENGQEVMERIEQETPDIILTDVKMPIMNGIELVGAVKKKYPEILSIVISGYQDFEYAKGALQYGVSEYVLKPVMPSDFQKVMEEAREKLQKLYHQKRKEIIHHICNGASYDCEKIEKYFNHGRYYAILIRKNGLPRRFSTGNNMEIYSDVYEQLIIYGRDEMESLYIVPKELLTGMDFQEYVRKIIEKEGCKSGYLTVIYGNNSFGTDSFNERVLELYRTLDMSSTVGMDQIVPIQKGAVLKEIKYDYPSMNKVLGNLDQLMQERQYNTMKKELQRLYQLWKEEKKPQLWLENMSRQICFVMHKYNNNTSALLEYEYMLEDAFFYATSIEELLNDLLEIIFKDVNQDSACLQKVDSPEFFQSVEAYLDSKLNEDITLQGVCKKFGVSQTYLSRLFRKYVQQSFGQYLTETRMKTAIRIMQETPGVFVKDVAAKVGYCDQFYFSRVFRSYIGKSPSDYLKDLQY